MSSLLTYSTAKVVVIKDKFLGFLRLLLLAPIIVYIVYAIFVNGKYYMLTHRPEGVVLTDVVRPATLVTTMDSYPYCTQAIEGDGNAKLQCVNVDATDVVTRSGSLSDVFVTTRFHTYGLTPNVGCTAASCSSPWTITGGTDPVVSPFEGGYFAAGVDDFDVTVYHYAQVSEFVSNPTVVDGKYSASSNNNRGVIYDTNNNEIGEFVAKGDKDTIPLSLLLKAGGVMLDNSCTASEGTCIAGSGTRLRHTGLVAMVFISYSNQHNLERGPQYNYRVRVLSDRYFVTDTQDATVSPTLTSKTIERRFGVKLMFLQVGAIGRFDFPTLFVHLASTLAFLLLATLLVDFMMLCVVPRRHLYNKMKYEDSVDFDRVVAKMDDLQSHTKGSLLTLDERENMAFKIVQEEEAMRTSQLQQEIMVDSEVNEHHAEVLRLRLLFGGAPTANPALTDHELELLYRAFADSNGVIPKTELRTVFTEIGVPFTEAVELRCEDMLASLRKRRIAASKANEANGVTTDDLAELDSTNIRKEEFILIMKAFDLSFQPRVSILLKDFAKNKKLEFDSDLEYLMAQFREMDTDDDDLIDYALVFKFLSNQDIKLSPPEFKALMAAIDHDHDGFITASEFCVVKMFLNVVLDGTYLANVGGQASSRAAATAATAPAAGSTPALPMAQTYSTNINNKLNSVNWNGVRSQFRALTAYINGLRDELRELTLITRMLQRRVIPSTLESVTDHEPVHLAGDWNGEQADECRIN